jgi:menaquinone-dependent protoporphyrinogen oxidase
LVPIGEAASLDLETFDRIVIGASIRYGKHSRQVIDFIRRNVALLESKPNAFFSVNLVARKAAKSRPETNPYMRKLLRQIPWKPAHLAVFAGKLDYPSYGIVDRLMIRLIMWLTGGPTDLKAVVDFTDWQKVAEFARRIGANG